MRPFSRRQVLRLALALALAPLILDRKAGRAGTVNDGTTIPLRILATTDLHCWLESWDYCRDAGTSRYGLVRLAALIAEARREAANTVLFDNGDLLQGNPMADFVARTRGLKPEETHPAFKALNLLHYNAATLGNHEFDYGLPFLERAISGAAFPYVCANVVHKATGEPYFRPFALLDRTLKDSAGQARTIRIGVFGVVTPQVTIWNRHQLGNDVTTIDIVESAEAVVLKLHAAGAQLVIALCHTGFGHPPHTPGEENAADAVSRIKGVDAVIAGHSHRVFPDISYAELPDLDLTRGTLGGTPAVMAGFYGSHLGVIDLTLALDGGKVTVAGARAETRTLQGSGAAPDPALVQALEADHRAATEYARQPVGILEQSLDTYFALVAPSPLLRLIADVQDWTVRRAMADEPELFAGHEALPLLIAVAPFRCGGRLGPENYSRLEAGPVAIRNVADIYMYPNVIEVVSVNGAGLREWLEMSALAFRQIHASEVTEQALLDRQRPAFDFDVIHGIEYVVDVAQPPRYGKGGAILNPATRRIVSLTMNGTPVQDDDRFLVATTDYRASGGGNFPGLDGGKTVYRSQSQMQEMIVAYLRERGPVRVDADGPWRFAPLPDGVTAVFESAPEASGEIPPGSGITFLRVAADGFGRFRLAA